MREAWLRFFPVGDRSLVRGTWYEAFDIEGDGGIVEGSLVKKGQCEVAKLELFCGRG